ncbi:MAG: aminotransferase class IV [Bdellovibrio sp.]|nr:aminotransferase class IV [Bdellovibrio sp.]
MNAIINVNGQVLGPHEAKVSIFDRGYLYGDSLYEVARSYGAQFYLLDQHLDRLKRSAELCKMKLDQDSATYKREIYKTLEAFRALPGNSERDAYMRLIVSRGSGKIGFSLSAIQTPTLYTIIVQSLDGMIPQRSAQRPPEGIKVRISPRIRMDRRALDPAMKSGNYLNSLLAYLDAAENGFDDALLCDYEGNLTEGTTFNLFYVRREIVATPPLENGILVGVTRSKVLEIAKDLGIQVREVRFPRERLFEADEVFLTSSLKEVLPIVQIDGRKIGDGNTGPITQKLQYAYRQKITQDTQRSLL